MPRINPRLFWQARALDPLLPRLLPPCRDIRSAQLELRWLREHASQQRSNVQEANHLLRHYVLRRGRGEPLQYLLGSEWFGDLELKCRPGVLIPRQETADSVTYLVDLLSSSSKAPGRLRILDLCTGTGCIPLLFHHKYYSYRSNKRSSLEIIGVDFSTKALRLARENHEIQLANRRDAAKSEPQRMHSLEMMKFVQADVLQEQSNADHRHPPVMEALRTHQGQEAQYDILISNPPYISTKEYLKSTSRSVRHYEPRRALVPPRSKSNQLNPTLDGDLFYPRLLDVASQVRAKIVLFEVSDLSQAERVVDMAVEKGCWDGKEIWRDLPNDDSVSTATDSTRPDHIAIRGSGHGRSVLLYRGDGATWLGR